MLSAYNTTNSYINMNYNLKNINKPFIACLKTVGYWTTDLEVDDLVYCVKRTTVTAEREHQLLGRSESAI